MEMPKTDHDVGSSPSRKLPLVEDEGVTKAQLDEMIAATKRDLSQQLENLGVLHDLRPEQRDKLIDVVMKFRAGYGQWRSFSQSTRLLRTDQRVGIRQRRMFRTKVTNAVAAVDDALKYAARVCDRNEIFARSLRGLATPFLQEAKKSLESIPLGWGNFTAPLEGSAFQSPKQDARFELMEYFSRDCHLTKSQASQRTGAIGNALLGWAIDLADQSDSANPKRARAVLKSYARVVKSRQPKRR